MLNPSNALHRHVHLHRELGWVEANAGPYELNAYWSRHMPHRPGWHRFEITRGSIVLGRLTVLATKPADARPLTPQPSSPPHLTCIKGGKAE